MWGVFHAAGVACEGELVEKPELTAAEKRAVELISKGMESPSFQPPILPAVAHEALLISKNPDLDLRQVASIIEKDSSLAARFLSVANSALYRRGGPATSVKSALTRMGLVAARDLLIYAALEKVFVIAKPLLPTVRALGHHSLAVSSGAGYLAQYKRIDIEDASLAGLVHDLGASAVLKYISDRTSVFKDLLSNAKALCNVLWELHSVAGAKLAERWELPPPVRKVIAEHHDEELTDPLVVLIAAADELALLCKKGVEFDRPQEGALARFLDGADPDVVTDAFMMRLVDVEAL
ncbi:MAG: HDOD domain-containing protein [Deltaproteobacteria bacterium]|nr:HDOD domain-containing protein [Deltaproteobacteria bacterium]